MKCCWSELFLTYILHNIFDNKCIWVGEDEVLEMKLKFLKMTKLHFIHGTIYLIFQKKFNSHSRFFTMYFE